MRIRSKAIFLALFLLCLGCVYAFFQNKKSIIQIDSISTVQEKVERLLGGYRPEDVLVLFDIDMTLVQPSNPVFSMGGMLQHRQELKQLLKGRTSQEKDILLNLLVQESPPELVEEEMPNLVQALQAKNIPCLAFTAGLTGMVNSKMSMEDYRYQTLKNNHIEFQTNFSDRVFGDLPSYLGRHPRLYKGILFSNGSDGTTTKGQVLEAFLEAEKYNLRLIILVDDTKRNLESVSKYLAKYDPTIQFFGFEYRAARKKQYAPVSQERFRQGWDGLIKQAQIFLENT